MAVPPPTCPSCSGTRTKRASGGILDGLTRWFCLLCGSYFIAKARG